MYSDQRFVMFERSVNHGKLLDTLATILDEVDGGRLSQDFATIGFEGAIPLKNYHQIVRALKNVFRIPFAKEIIPEDLDLFSIFKIPFLEHNLNLPLECDDSFSKENNAIALRRFVAGISRHYNNLLMGIQGNLSLILLSFGKHHPYLPIIKNAEELVQSGSFAISLLLGYLAERRCQTRKIRFNHLVKEVATIQGYVPSEEDRLQFERWVKELPKLEGLAHISERCTQSFDRLIGSISNWTEWIRLSGEVDDRISARLVKIREMTKTGYDISGKLLAFASKGNFGLRRMSLRDIFDTCIEDFKARQPDIGLKLYHHRHHRIDLFADTGHLCQVLLELLQNSAESMSNYGNITLSAKKLTLSRRRSRGISINPGAYVMITIKDNGTGMDEKVKAKAFEPFFTTKNSGKANGLGLSMAYGVAKQLGGAVTIDSKPGDGTQVRLLLPRI